MTEVSQSMTRTKSDNIIQCTMYKYHNFSNPQNTRVQVCTIHSHLNRVAILVAYELVNQEVTPSVVYVLSA